jgi:hypothetical protein
MFIAGAGRDAAFIAEHIATRTRAAAVPAVSTT